MNMPCVQRDRRVVVAAATVMTHRRLMVRRMVAAVIQATAHRATRPRRHPMAAVIVNQVMAAAHLRTVAHHMAVHRATHRHPRHTAASPVMAVAISQATHRPPRPMAVHPATHLHRPMVVRAMAAVISQATHHPRPRMAVHPATHRHPRHMAAVMIVSRVMVVRATHRPHRPHMVARAMAAAFRLMVVAIKAVMVDMVARLMMADHLVVVTVLNDLDVHKRLTIRF